MDSAIWFIKFPEAAAWVACIAIKRVAIYYLNTEAVCLRNAIYLLMHLFSQSVHIYIYTYIYIYIYINWYIYIYMYIDNWYLQLWFVSCLSHGLLMYIFSMNLLFLQHVCLYKAMVWTTQRKRENCSATSCSNREWAADDGSATGSSATSSPATQQRQCISTGRLQRSSGPDLRKATK